MAVPTTMMVVAMTVPAMIVIVAPVMPAVIVVVIAAPARAVTAVPAARIDLVAFDGRSGQPVRNDCLRGSRGRGDGQRTSGCDREGESLHLFVPSILRRL